MLGELTKGLYKENPVFRLLLGLCPTLAVTTSAINGFGMGMATTFVLICSNIIVSLVKKLIPSAVRIPSFIVIIATFVTIVDMFMEAFAYPLYENLGIFIPLIVVNCLILGRAEAFASKESVLPSLLDAVGMGLGFTLSLTVLGGIREILSGSIGIFGMPPGAFLTLGLLLGLINFITLTKLKRS
ncbi:electron transport complex subunit RsxE [Anaerobranca gottschalkii]|uniref:Ion-translocating oxidoreductase complex subunit E n=1 Tax=Anaerobranca gottschalkii DSM 13577 TaxID=1120990 RepID=A0A1H9Y9X5_9FIRM|nr:electron transport complex subunit E [Anaerobranca gottschalkii]SES65647.1 electron transport complex protein RnfE [Anaerobranca gottschalkii DSM 13577]